MKRLLLIVIIVFFLVPSVMAEKELFPDARVTTADEKIKVDPKDLETLKKRVDDYWGLRIKNDYIKAFDYEDPKTKEKYNIDLQEYLVSKARVKYHNIRIDEINFVRQDYAKITVFIKYTFSWLETITDEKDGIEKWVKREDGKWYRIFTTNAGQTPLEN